MRTFNSIVVGLGAMGGAALWHLAARGQKVLGIEQFGIGHDRGSSHGKTRIIRRAYFEHPAYVPLVDAAYRLWNKLESAAGRNLFLRTGLLMFGPPSGQLIAGVKRAAAEHGLDIRELSPDDVRARFPDLHPTDDMQALFEADAGLLRVEDCIRAQVDEAVSHGAETLFDEPVRSWRVTGGAVEVTTDTGKCAAERLVICGGAWTSRLLSDLNLPLHVRRKVMMWFAPTHGRFHVDAGCPVFCFDSTDGFFYGFPVLDENGLKVGEHTGGTVVADPDRLDRNLHDDDLRKIRSFLSAHVSGVEVTPVRHSVCMYTMTPDDHFIVDRHPRFENVVFAAGFSGHGFKFAPIVGSILADHALTGRTEQPTAFLSLARFHPSP